MAATDVKQVGINFGGRDYFQSFPKLEKRGRIPKRGKPYWGSTGAGETSIEETVAAQVEPQISVEDQSTDVGEKPREIAAEEVPDQEEGEAAYEEPKKSNDEDRDIEEKEVDDFKLDDERQKLGDSAQEEEDGVVSATENSVDPQKSSNDVEEERETSAADGAYGDDYVFFGTFRTLIRKPKMSTAVDKVIIQEEREVIEEDVGAATQTSVDEEKSEETESIREEIEGFVSAKEASVDEQKSEATESNSEEIEGFVSAKEASADEQQKSEATESNREEIEGFVSAKETSVDVQKSEATESNSEEIEDFVSAKETSVDEKNSEAIESNLEEIEGFVSAKETSIDGQKSEGTESNREEIECVVSEIQKIEEIPQKPTSDVEEGIAQESELAQEKEGVVSAENFGEIPQKPSADVEKGADEKKDNLDDEAQELGDERGSQELAAAAVIKQEEKKAAGREEEEKKVKEEICFGGENYDDHFPKIEMKRRITKRERRGEFQN